MAERFFKRGGDVVQREVAGELFLVPIRGHLADLQQLFVLNEVGHWLWARLSEPASLSSLVTALRDEFEVDEAQAREDAVQFLQQLCEAGLAQESALPDA